MAYTAGYPINFTALGDKTSEAIYKACIQETTKIYSHLNLLRKNFLADASLYITGEVGDISELPATGTIGDIYAVFSATEVIFYAWDGSTWKALNTIGFPIASETAPGLVRRAAVEHIMDRFDMSDTAVVTEDVLVEYGYFTGFDVPRGTIVPWWGNINAVPVGWSVCDGTNGTPNYAGNFLRGAVDYSVLGTGGEDATRVVNSSLIAHAHAFSVEGAIDNHQHDYSFTVDDSTSSHDHVVTCLPAQSALAGEHRHILAVNGNSITSVSEWRANDRSSCCNNNNYIYQYNTQNLGGTVQPGGAHSHTVDQILPQQTSAYVDTHKHDAYGVSEQGGSSELILSGETGATEIGGEADFNNMPAYMNLLYIMKI